MKTLLSSLLFLFVSLGCQAQFGINIFRGTTGKAVIKFKNGTKEVGVIRENGPVFGTERDDPQMIKFKSDGATDSRLVSSDDILSVDVYDKKRKDYYVTYFPLRIKINEEKYTFGDKTFVEFYPLMKYADVPYAEIHFFDGMNGSVGYKWSHYLFPYGNTGDYFAFNGGYRRTNRESAQFMMMLDRDCSTFQAYMQENYLDTNNYKEAYKAEVKEFKKNKAAFIKERKAEGYTKGQAKTLYLSGEFFIYFKQILEKYKELCTHENHNTRTTEEN